jgi:hypothetical protein
MKYFKFKKTKLDRIKMSKNGFTLFIAMIVTGLILGVGFSITNILLKELSLSSTGKESQVAFYAADSAAECAMYWDRKQADGTAVDVSPFDRADLANGINPPPMTDIHCGAGISGDGEAGSPTRADFDINHPDNTVSTFYVVYNYGTDNISCAKVTVTKGAGTTEIDSRGYNVGPTGSGTNYTCDISNPRTVERGIKINY